jgi:putative NADH-flavin reductase
MKILVFGATGRIGNSIVDEALSRGHEVTAAVRSLANGSTSDPQLRFVSAQIDDAASVEEAARDQDAVISAVGGLGHENPRIVIESIKPLVQGMMRSEVRRLLVVGTAGTLEVASGGLRKDQPDFPERLREEAESHAETLEFLRQLSPESMKWTYFSPPARIEPGA